MTDLALVTGGSGFIGWHLVRQLSATGWHVRVLDTAPPPEARDRVDYIEGSVTDPAAVAQAMTGARWVFHLAALSQLWDADPKRYDAVNYGGTRTVLAAARVCGPERLVHCSTEVILRGWRDRRAVPLTEAEPLPALADMAGPYTRSKWRAERHVRAAMADGLPLTIVYPTMPIGPGDRGPTPPGALLVQMVTAPPPAYLPCLFNLAPAEDVAAGMILAADKAFPGERFLLGGETLAFMDLLALLKPFARKPLPRRRIPYWLAELSARVATARANRSGRPPIAPLEGVRLVRHDTVLDSGLAARRLGWKARPIHRILPQTIDDLLASPK